MDGYKQELLRQLKLISLHVRTISMIVDTCRVADYVRITTNEQFLFHPTK